MILITGQLFKESIFSYSYNRFVKTPYMGRTVVGAAPGASNCVGEHGPGSLDHVPFGTAGAYADSPQVAWDCRLIMAGKTSALTEAEETVLLRMMYGTMSDDGGYCRVGFSVFKSGSDHILKGGFIESTGGGVTFTDYVDLATITLGGANFYDVSYLVFSDRVRFYSDGVYVNEVAFSHDYNSAYPYYGEMNIYPGTFNWVADYLHYVRHEVNTGTALNRVLQDYVPANGTLYLISKADLSAMLTAGEATQLLVSGGDIATEAVADDDYLLVQVLEDNLSTIALKYTKAAGVWAKSNWSIP